jgi:hypothetical protein
VTGKLADFCDVKLGFKSLQNMFFYVDEATIDRFGIEDEFLVPIFMLGDLDENSYVQRVAPTRWVFTCEKHEPDLLGTGAWDYIDWSGRQTIRARKQAKGVTTVRDALARQGGKEWWFPKAPHHPTQLAVRKGIGDRYAPFVFDQPVVLDQRLYLLFPVTGISVDVLTAFMVSSLFPLSLETNADLGLGAGVLTLSTAGLKHLPCPDLAAIEASESWPKVKSQLLKVLESPTPTAAELPKASAVRRLDGLLLQALGISASRAKEPSEAAAMLARARLDRSKQRKLVRAAASAADIERTSQPVVERLRAWWAARAFPQDYVPDGAATRAIHLPDGVLKVELTYLMGQLTVEISDASGKQVFSDEMDASSGELVLRCLQLGRRSFKVTCDERESYELLSILYGLCDEFTDAFRMEIEHTSLGSLYETALGRLVLEKLKIDLPGLHRDLHASRTWEIPA